MIYEFDSFDAYHAACEADPDLRGVSPGGARSMLCITRQGVFSAVKRGSLDMIRIMENGTGPYLVIPQKSIDSYLSDRSGRKGPVPGFRQRIQMHFDKHIAHVWPNDKG